MAIDSVYDKRVDRFEADCWTLADFLVDAAHQLALQRVEERRRTARPEAAVDEALADLRHILEASSALRILPRRFHELEIAQGRGVELDRAAESFVVDDDPESFRAATMARLTVNGAAFTVSVLLAVMDEYVLGASDDRGDAAVALVPSRFFERLAPLIARVTSLRALLTNADEPRRLAAHARETEQRYHERAAHRARAMAMNVEAVDTASV